MTTDEIRRMLAEATPGPWTCDGTFVERETSCIETGRFADASLIAAAPYLAAEVVRLREEVAWWVSFFDRWDEERGNKEKRDALHAEAKELLRKHRDKCLSVLEDGQ